MASISDVAAYICMKYPHKSELSKTRLTKLVYLADWKAAQQIGRQITDIEWYFHNFGPYVEDVYDSVRNDSRFEIVNTENYYGDRKLEIHIKDDIRPPHGLDKTEIDIIDSVVKETSNMYWNSFIQHVYSTDPIENSNRYQPLDLVLHAARARGGALLD
ncbi:MAG: Panacea domain-containing protein [Martelella sp.]|uniref:Panacea domain-containing protein n=1 Tax=Martelella sp. TaxID=1969699 RepID=UPI0032427D65